MMPKPPPERPAPLEIPDGPVTGSEVIGGIRRMAHGETADTTRLRAWELLGRVIGLFKDAPAEGGAPVVRLTPPLDDAPSDAPEDSHDQR